MSHLVAIKTEVKDLEAVALAAVELGGELVTTVKRGRWYGQWVNDYAASDAAYRQGIPTDQYGRCDAVIRFPGIDYDVMLMKNPETGGYKVYWDFYGPGAQIEAKVGGRNAERLLQLYGVNKATLEARRKGLMVSRQLKPSGVIRLSITGRTL